MNPLQDRLQRALGASYRVERELGGGGMSHVYLAEEVALGRRVVIKVLPPDMAASVSVDRFRREIQLAAQLQHPGIVPLLTAGADGDLLWYVMPYVEGESLRTRMARGPLPIDEAVRLWRDLLEALEYAHGRGIVHRDIKPENIMLTGRRAVTLDFGVAKAVSASTGSGASTTGVGFVVGTPAYMAPEQAAGDGNVDARADLYAAGLVMYEMLAGRGPFEARTPAEWMAAHIATAPAKLIGRDLESSPALHSLVMATLAKRPEERPESAAALLAALEIVPSNSSAPPRVPRSAGQRAVLISSAALFSLAAAGIVFWRGRDFRGNGTDESKAPAVVLADSARLQVAFLPTIAEPRDSILAQSVLQAQIASLQATPVVLAQTPTAIRRLAEDVGIPTSTPDSLRQLYRDLGIHTYLQQTIIRSGDGLLLVTEGYASNSDSTLFRLEAPTNSAAELSSTTASMVAKTTAAITGYAGRIPRPAVSGRLFGTTPEAASLYLQARQSFDEGEYARAARQLRPLLAAYPDFAAAWSLLGSSNRNGQLSEHEGGVALSNAHRLIDQIPNRVNRAFEAMIYLRYTGRSDSALVLARKAAAEFPGELVIGNELGQILSELRNFGPALEAYRVGYETALARRTSNVVLLNFVRALIRLGRVDDARKALAQLEKALGPNDFQVLSARESIAAGLLAADSLILVGHTRLQRAGADRDRQPGLTALSSGMLLSGRLDSVLQVERERRMDAQANNRYRLLVRSVASEAYWRAALLGDVNQSRVLDSALRSARWDTLQVRDRGYDVVVPAYVAARDIARARQALTDWERGVPPEFVLAQRPLIEAARGEIALAEHDGVRALRAFRAANVGRCSSCGAARLARAHDQLNESDSAIVWYERMLFERNPRVNEVDFLEYPRAYRRLGELYEAKGDTKRAIQRYGDFVELWKNADPALQPLVKDVRERIARLQRKTG